MARSPAFRFYPSDFMGAPDVQAMDLHEVGAYTLLLCTAWLSERHGYLPDDENLLRRWAKMTREQWTESRALLLKKFPVVEDGWRANPRMVREAEKQVAFSASQAAKGAKGGRPAKKPGLIEIKPGLSNQKPDESQTKAQQKPSVSVSVSATDEGQKQKTPRAKKPRAGFYEPVKELIFRYYRAKNEVDPEWDGQEGKSLAMLLAANPNAPLEHWKKCLTNRYHSDITHGERPGAWLRKLSSFTVPLNEYGKPLNGGSNGTTKTVQTTNNNRAALLGLVARRRAESGSGSGGTDRPGADDGQRPIGSVGGIRGDSGGDDEGAGDSGVLFGG
jgi:uncharacterized protein YdaU (DUF1376 family)